MLNRLEEAIMSTRSRKVSSPSTDPGDFREEIKTLIKEEIKNAFANFVKKTLQKELLSIVVPLKEQLDSLKSENAKLCDDLSNMEKEVKRISLKSNANEQYSRKFNLPIGGITEEPDEDCYEMLSNFLESQLGISISDTEIDQVHRVGRPGQARPRQMIVKLHPRSSAHFIYMGE